MKAKIVNRKLHRWGSLIIAVPIIIVVVSGIILQLKKESAWIQPPTVQTSVREPSLSYEKLIAIVKDISQIDVDGWEDIDRLDVRPGKGVIKVRAKSNWEVQLNARTGDVLQVAYRRSDLIESIHDGSYFHESFKLWVFLPAGVLLALLWGTGMYLFALPHLLKHRKRYKAK
jgi:uncharacterized iron-regulated membrane protein